MSRFHGRTAFVTGAGSGIGREIALQLSTEGANVVAADIGFDPKSSPSGRSNFAEVRVDIRREEDVSRAIEEAIARSGQIDILVNAAGVMIADDVADIRDDTWNTIIEVNLTGAMRVCRAVLPDMRRRARGAIVNVSSVAAFNASAGMASYAASKSGLVALTRALANRYGADGVRANCVCPGWVRTPMSEAEMADFAQANGTSVEQEFSRVAQRIALGRVAEPAEIARCAAFLASDDASFVTGAVLVADGGARTAATSRSH